MARACTICTHADRQEIDAALVAGENPETQIAALFRVSADALARHRARHLPAKLAKAKGAEEAADADDLLAQVQDLRTRALSILDTAEEAGNLKAALGAIREARESVRLLAELAGKLQQQRTVNIVLLPEWVALRTRIARALEPFPDARVAVVEAIGAE